MKEMESTLTTLTNSTYNYKGYSTIQKDLLWYNWTTLSRNQYILVVTDIFTKWIEAFSLVNTTSATLAKVLIDEVIW